MHFPGNLLIGEILEEFTKYLFLTHAENDGRLEYLTISDEFFGTLSQTVEQVSLDRDQYVEINRNLTVQHAINREQAGDLPGW
jgi:hypothetical protein